MATIAVVFLIPALITGFYWLDNKYQWRLIAWCNGETQDPFRSDTASEGRDKDQQILRLEERIAVLEKLVTDPAWQLEQEFKKLKE